MTTAQAETPAERLVGKLMEQIEAHYAHNGAGPEQFLEVFDALASAVGLVRSTADRASQPHLDRFFAKTLQSRRMQIAEIERDAIVERITRVRKAR